MVTNSTNAQFLPDWLERQSLVSKDKLAITDGQQSLTYGELYGVASRLAERLQSLGIEQSRRVGVLFQSGFAYACVVHAVMQAKVTMVSLNYRLTATELAWQLADAEVDLLIHDEGCRDLADAVVKASSTPLSTWLCDAAELRARGLEEPVTPRREHAAICLSDAQAMMYTSGTTGFPKGVVLTYGNHFYGAMASAVRLGVLPDDKWLIPMPLFHVGGLAVLMRSVIYGTAVVIHDKFDAKRVNKALDDEQITMLSVVPTMLQRMMAERDGVPYATTLRSVLLGGSAAPVSLVEAALSLGLPISQSYGLTESNSQATTLATADAMRKLGSSGLPLLTTDVAIFHEGKPVRTSGVEGEIAVSGPTVTRGYWHRPEANAESFVDGWFLTGDIGYLDDEGYLFVLDRRKDLIVSGGENVYPAEVESVLCAFSGVREAAVVGEAHLEWGEVPIAFVVIDDGMDITEAELLTHCRQQLARYKVPVRVQFVDGLPRNASGKLLRKNLRK